MSDAPLLKLRHAMVALALWLVATVYLICNLGHMQLVVAVNTDAPDVAHVYYSRDALWNEPESVAAMFAPGSNAVSLSLPILLTGSIVRFDPGRRATTYRISSVRWRCGSSEIALPLTAVTNGRIDASGLTSSAGELDLVARDNNPELIIPTPDWSARIAAAFWPLGLSLGMLAFVAWALRRRVALPHIAAALLAICALVYFAACLLVGPRLPLVDDWRYVLPGPFNLIDGSWRWLAVVGNDTYFLTNQVLDFLVLKFSNVDFRWLRGVAVALLLLQLALQYRVVSRAAQAAPAVAAVAVALGIWSLTAGAYWGGTAIAYQQALPTLFGTMMLVQLLASDGTFRFRVSLGVLLACCIASGLAYISGGLLIATLGVAYLLAISGQRMPRSALRVAAVLVGAGIILLTLQVTLVCINQGSLLEHNHHSPSVYPNDRRFWLVFVAQFGRALGYGGDWLPADLFCTVLVLFPATVLALQRLRALVRGGVADPHPAWTMLALYAGIGSAGYAAMIAFGRAGFAPADAAATAVTALGKARFHFWPIAAMLPYTWLGWAALVQHMRAGAMFAAAAVGAVMLAPKSLLLLDHVSALREMDRLAHDGARCAVTTLADAEAGRPMLCTGSPFVPVQAISTFIHLRQIKSRLYDEIVEEGTETSR